MAIIKKGITYDGTPVNTLTYGGTQVKEVWYGTDKLVYFYGEGTQGLSYTKTGSLLQVSGIGTSTETNIVIPVKTYEYLDQNTIYNVTSIGANAFEKNKNIKSVDIEGYNKIEVGADAFNGCFNLEQFPIERIAGDTIAENAFKSCNLKKITLSNKFVSRQSFYGNSGAILTYSGTEPLSVGFWGFYGIEYFNFGALPYNSSFKQNNFNKTISAISDIGTWEAINPGGALEDSLTVNTHGFDVGSFLKAYALFDIKFVKNS